MKNDTPPNLDGIDFGLPSQEALAHLSGMVQKQASLEDKVEALKKELAETEKELTRYSDELIPHEMISLGLSGLTMEDGSKISITDFYAASIPKASNNAAMAWLRNNGHDGMIKSTVTVSLGRDEQEKRPDLLKVIRDNGFLPEEKDTVHPSTLKSWVKECTEQAIEFPHKLFGVFIGKRAKIQRK